MSGDCHVCGEKDSTFFHVKNKFSIYQCNNCSLLFVDPIPKDLSVYYTKGYFTGDVTLDGYMDYDEDKKASPVEYEVLLDKIATYVGKDPSETLLLEVGCATGVFLEQAKRKGHVVEGIDISEYAVDAGIKKDLHISCGTLDTFDSDRVYDVIVMLDVIEHVQNPRHDIQKMKSLLSPGGVIVCVTPDAGSLYARILGKRWHAFVPPQHLYYFSKKNLASLFAQEGFETLVSSHHKKKFSIPYIFRALYSWQGLRLWRWCAQKSNSISLLRNIHITIALRDNMLLVFKKRGGDTD